MTKEERFKKNGGYFIGEVAYMDCKETGEPVPNVSIEAASVISSNATLNRCLALMSEDARNRLFGVTSKTKGPKKPRGWRWMNEFVDADGNVFYKGVEMPDLKGTIEPTDLDKLKLERRAKKASAKKRDQRRLLRHAKKQKAAKRKKKLTVKEALKKQKDFLKGNTND